MLLLLNDSLFFQLFNPIFPLLFKLVYRVFMNWLSYETLYSVCYVVLVRNVDLVFHLLHLNLLSKWYISGTYISILSIVLAVRIIGPNRTFRRSDHWRRLSSERYILLRRLENRK